MASFLRWVGSKARCADEIIKEFPIRFKDYYEPFLGSGSVYFKLYHNQRVWERSFLSDINPHLVRCWNAVKDNPENVKKVLSHLLEKNSEEQYYRMRSEVASPAVFLYLNRAGFSSLYRENSKGQFNVPYRKLDFEKRPIGKSTEEIDECSRYMAAHPTWIRNLSFTQLLCTDNSPGEADVVYFDPPYIPYRKDGFVDYSQTGFCAEDHKCLASIARGCAERSTRVYLSNSITEDSLAIYGEPAKVISVVDSVKAKARDKGIRKEGLWIFK